jgi:hypothetical protein
VGLGHLIRIGGGGKSSSQNSTQSSNPILDLSPHLISPPPPTAILVSRPGQSPPTPASRRLRRSRCSRCFPGSCMAVGPRHGAHPKPSSGRGDPSLALPAPDTASDPKFVDLGASVGGHAGGMCCTVGYLSTWCLEPGYRQKGRPGWCDVPGTSRYDQKLLFLCHLFPGSRRSIKRPPARGHFPPPPPEAGTTVVSSRCSSRPRSSGDRAPASTRRVCPPRIRREAPPRRPGMSYRTFSCRRTATCPPDRLRLPRPFGSSTSFCDSPSLLLLTDAKLAEPLAQVNALPPVPRHGSSNIGSVRR